MNAILEYKRLREKKAAFKIKAEQIKQIPPKQLGEDILQFCFRVVIEPENSGADFFLVNEINFVQYLLGDMFDTSSTIAKNADDNFEIKIWAHNNVPIVIAASLYMVDGSMYSINGIIPPYEYVQAERAIGAPQLHTH